MKKIIFDFNSDKAMQVLLWIINKKQGISLYNIMKIVFEAEKYHVNKYGAPVYGDSYEAWEYGTVPSYMYKIAKMEHNVPFYKCDCSENGLKTNNEPKMSLFSDTEIEALEHGFAEYGNLSFDEACKKNHKESAWKKYEDRVKLKEQHIPILYEDFISDPEIISYLEDVSVAMVL